MEQKVRTDPDTALMCLHMGNHVDTPPYTDIFYDLRHKHDYNQSNMANRQAKKTWLKNFELVHTEHLAMHE